MSFENIPKNADETAVLTETLIPKDYFVEVAEGNVPGSSLTAIIAKNRAVGTSYEDVSGFGGVMALPTAPESYEIVSTSANDSAAGTGARTVVLETLDADYNTQITEVTLNGTTPVAIANTHIRPRTATVITAGSTGENEGDITVRVAGGGVTRNYITAGDSASLDGHYTVPAGKKLYVLQTFSMVAKDDSAEVRTRFRFEGADSSWITSAPVPLYQNMLNFEVKALVTFPEKADIHLQGRADSGTVNMSVIYEILLIDQ